MKKILAIGFILAFGCGYANAGQEVQETATLARGGYVAVSTHVAVDMSSSTLVPNTFAYNICNEGAIGGENIRCGYTSSVSTIAANVNLGFWVKPQECEYRAVGNSSIIYCKAAGTAVIGVSRELFGHRF